MMCVYIGKRKCCCCVRMRCICRSIIFWCRNRIDTLAKLWGQVVPNATAAAAVLALKQRRLISLQYDTMKRTQQPSGRTHSMIVSSIHVLIASPRFAHDMCICFGVAGLWLVCVCFVFWFGHDGERVRISCYSDIVYT